MKTWLLETGPIVALLDASDPGHKKTSAVFSSFRGVLLSTGVVLTEAFYLLRYAPDGGKHLVEFVEQAGVSIVDVFGLGELREIAELMEKYSDQPMDFADASLVIVAEKRNHNEVLTLDERGFRAYRFRGTRRFRLPIQDG